LIFLDLGKKYRQSVLVFFEKAFDLSV